jgi:hypothetical protein
MSAYRKFSDFRQSDVRAVAPPKPAKAPKRDPAATETFGGLGALGGASLQIRNSEQPVWPLDRALATWAETEAERAAIVEHDGNFPHAWAEGFARLHPDRPPADVPLRRWQQFVDDVGRFLDSSFCAAAAALGWGPLELFGADRDRPFARIGESGLLWLLNGGRLIVLTENTATIERETRARRTYRREATEPGRVLAWELADAEQR